MLALLAAVAGEAGAAVPDLDALPAEYQAAMPGERFAETITQVCPSALMRAEGLAGMPGLTQVDALPSYLAAYPATPWFALEAAPRNVFVSFDAATTARRCRVVMANNIMPGFAHLRATVAAEMNGFKMIDSPKIEPRRGLLESVWSCETGSSKALMILIQSLPNPVNAGRGWQATATAAVLDR